MLLLQRSRSVRTACTLRSSTTERGCRFTSRGTSLSTSAEVSSLSSPTRYVHVHVHVYVQPHDQGQCTCTSVVVISCSIDVSFVVVVGGAHQRLPP